MEEGFVINLSKLGGWVILLENSKQGLWIWEEEGVLGTKVSVSLNL